MNDTIDRLLYTKEAMSTMQKDLTVLSKKYEFLIGANNKTKEAITLCKEHGACKSFITGYLNGSIKEILEETTLSKYFALENYDHIPQKNERSEELSNAFGTISDDLNNIIPQVKLHIDNLYKNYIELSNEFILLAKKQLLKYKEELSNTSLEVIPAKAREVDCHSYPILNDMINIDSQKETLTIHEMQLNTDKVVRLTDSIIGSCCKLSKDQCFLSEKPSEMKDTLSKMFTKTKRQKKVVLEGIYLIRQFKTCY